MWRNKQDRKFKELRRKHEEYHALRPYNRSENNSVPIDEPYQRGEYRFFELRDDAKRHPHADIFKKILGLIQNLEKCRKGDWLQYSIKAGRKLPWNHVLRRVDKRKLEKELPKWAIDKYFVWAKESTYRYTTNRYIFTGPSYYFVTVIKPYIVTHRTVIDGEAASREAELDAWLEQNLAWCKLFPYKDDWTHPPYRRGKEKNLANLEVQDEVDRLNTEQEWAECYYQPYGQAA